MPASGWRRWIPSDHLTALRLTGLLTVQSRALGEMKAARRRKKGPTPKHQGAGHSK